MRLASPAHDEVRLLEQRRRHVPLVAAEELNRVEEDGDRHDAEDEADNIHIAPVVAVEPVAVLVGRVVAALAVRLADAHVLHPRGHRHDVRLLPLRRVVQLVHLLVDVEVVRDGRALARARGEHLVHRRLTHVGRHARDALPEQRARGEGRRVHSEHCRAEIIFECEGSERKILCGEKFGK